MLYSLSREGRVQKLGGRTGAGLSPGTRISCVLRALAVIHLHSKHRPSLMRLVWWLTPGILALGGWGRRTATSSRSSCIHCEFLVRISYSVRSCLCQVQSLIQSRISQEPEKRFPSTKGAVSLSLAEGTDGHQ